MPYEIFQTGNRNIDVKGRADELSQQAAIEILHGLRSHVGNNEGVLKLVHTTRPESEDGFELKSSNQYYELRGSKMRDTSGYLRGVFDKALEGYSPQIRTDFLDGLDVYLKEHDNKIEPEAVGTFVDRLDNLQRPPPIAVEEPYPWGPGITRLDTKELAKPWDAPGATLRTGRVERVEQLGSGGSGEVWRVRVPLTDAGHVYPRYLERALKTEKNVDFFPVSTASSKFPLLRASDFAASRFKSGKGLICPEYYYVQVKEDEYSRKSPTCYRVSAQAMKKFVRNEAKRNPNAQIGMYATLIARGQGKGGGEDDQ